MIGRLTGIIENIKRNPLIIEVAGVGYLVHVPETLLQLSTPGAKTTLFIHTHVREDVLDLYGFSSEEDLALFELLLTVSGIGPKTALTVMARGASNVEIAVKRGDVDFFTSVPRLGKKNAQKIIIELKNKLGGKDLALNGQNDGETKEIMDALLTMGFERREIIEVVKSLDETAPIEKRIRQAIKALGKHL